MLKWMTSALLAASALAPTVASAQQAPMQDDRADHRGADERGDRRGPDRQNRDGEERRAPQADQRAQAQVAQPVPQVQQQGGRQGVPYGDRRDGGRRDGVRPDGQREQGRRDDVGRNDVQRDDGRHEEGRRDDPRDRRGPQGGMGVQGGYPGRGDPRGYEGGPRGGPGYTRRDEGREWNRGWRGDRRYDYGGYRNQNRGAFHLSRYYAPANWHYGYRRFSIGVTLGYGLFGGNYWISNPYDYRLPPAYGPYRWVRYYNDALLVDTRSGYVVDAVYDIFF